MKKLTLLWIKIVVSVVFAAALGVGGWLGFKELRRVRVEHMHATLSERMQKVAELTVIKDMYSDVVCVKKKSSGGLSRAYSIVKFSGVIRVGVRDVSRIKVGISADGKHVNVMIPPAQIIGNSLVAQEVFDEKSSFFVPITMQEIFDEIQNGMEEKERTLVEGGILSEADEQVRSLVRTMLEGFKFEKISISTIVL